MTGNVHFLIDASICDSQLIRLYQDNNPEEEYTEYMGPALMNLSWFSYSKLDSVANKREFNWDGNGIIYTYDSLEAVFFLLQIRYLI